MYEYSIEPPPFVVLNWSSVLNLEYIKQKTTCRKLKIREVGKSGKSWLEPVLKTPGKVQRQFTASGASFCDVIWLDLIKVLI